VSFDRLLRRRGEGERDEDEAREATYCSLMRDM